MKSVKPVTVAEYKAAGGSVFDRLSWPRPVPASAFYEYVAAPGLDFTSTQMMAMAGHGDRQAVL